jgi:hypothetical protein
LISSNNSIDFVQRFQWIRSTIPLDLFRHSAAFVASIRRFRRSFPAVLRLQTGAQAEETGLRRKAYAADCQNRQADKWSPIEKNAGAHLAVSRIIAIFAAKCFGCRRFWSRLPPDLGCSACKELLLLL